MEGHGIRSNAPQAASAGKAGFTLVEVCLAVGIIAFAVLPLLGLLSIGLNSYRNAVVRARATQVLNQIANALRRAVPVTSNGTPTGQFLALAPFPQPPGTGAVTWTPAATPTAQLYTAYFDENGTFLQDANSISSSPPVSPTPPPNAVMAAAVVLTPPTTTYSAGTAQITVGWPATPRSGPFYTSPSFSYGFVQGHVENTISLPPVAAVQ